mmetsp:Transcript_38274/g.92979  ORF Transcript_38274/g.92979 Transcript_38274/m.92979 type:complete len:488 (-) Transcript_38274:28-1491(-)
MNYRLTAYSLHLVILQEQELRMKTYLQRSRMLTRAVTLWPRATGRSMLPAETVLLLSQHQAKPQYVRVCGPRRLPASHPQQSSCGIASEGSDTHQLSVWMVGAIRCFRGIHVHRRLRIRWRGASPRGDFTGGTSMDGRISCTHHMTDARFPCQTLDIGRLCARRRGAVRVRGRHVVPVHGVEADHRAVALQLEQLGRRGVGWHRPALLRLASARQHVRVAMHPPWRIGVVAGVGSLATCRQHIWRKRRPPLVLRGGGRLLAGLKRLLIGRKVALVGCGPVPVHLSVQQEGSAVPPQRACRLRVATAHEVLDPRDAALALLGSVHHAGAARPRDAAARADWLARLVQSPPRAHHIETVPRRRTNHVHQPPPSQRLPLPAVDDVAHLEPAALGGRVVVHDPDPVEVVQLDPHGARLAHLDRQLQRHGRHVRPRHLQLLLEGARRRDERPVGGDGHHRAGAAHRLRRVLRQRRESRAAHAPLRFSGALLP